MQLFVFQLLILAIYCDALSQSKPPSKISPASAYYEKNEEGLILLANNNGYCPYTISVKLDLINMNSDKGDFFEIVVPGQTQRMEIGQLTIRDRSRKSSFSMGSTYLLGNAIEMPNHTGTYQLPYRSGETYIMSQGFNGSFSHTGKNALDFTMDLGTQICAARDGIVTEVIDHNSRGCKDPSCIYEANTITIYHEDGTFADYAHLKKRGSKVQPGDEVIAGQVIGYSGNTGFSSGPHLHFEVYYFDGEKKVSIPIKFDLGDKKSVYLEEKASYTAQ